MTRIKITEENLDNFFKVCHMVYGIYVDGENPELNAYLRIPDEEDAPYVDKAFLDVYEDSFMDLLVDMLGEEPRSWEPRLNTRDEISEACAEIEAKLSKELCYNLLKETIRAGAEWELVILWSSKSMDGSYADLLD